MTVSVPDRCSRDPHAWYPIPGYRHVGEAQSGRVVLLQRQQAGAIDRQKHCNIPSFFVGRDGTGRGNNSEDAFPHDLATII
jgi:hypothetical protein